MAVPAIDPIPEVDYLRTAVRPAWPELPGPVRDLVADLCHSPVAQAGPPAGSGFTNGYAGRLRLRDGRVVFVKAGGGDLNPFVLPSYRREAEVLALLPGDLPVPQLLATGEADSDLGTYRVLVLQAVDGRQPGGPWTEADLAAVHATCGQLGARLTPAPESLWEDELADVMLGDEATTAYFDRLVAGEVEVTWGQPGWVAERAPELADLVHAARPALRGDTAVHGDLRADNLVLDQDGTAWVVDWNWLSRGPAWSDLVGVLPLARADGVDVGALVRSSPLTSSVPPDEVDAWLAVIAAYMLAQSPQPVWPGGPPSIRVHQRRYARTFLDWLGARRGWDR